jgi:hypothetical protein
VQSATGDRRLPLLVGAGTGELTLRIEAAPGWIEAAAATPGIFVLYDAAGTALGQFRRTARVLQSLPEGSYKIGFTGPSGQETVEDFAIVLGQSARIAFP